MYNEDRSRNEKAYTFFKEEDTMKKKIIAGCLLAALACSMIGCGKKKETNAPAQVDETFQRDEKDTEEDTKKDDTSADTTQAEPDNDEAVVTELKKSAAAYEAVVYAMYQPDISKDGVAYVPSDAQFFWLTVCFAANNAGKDIEGVSYDENTGIYTIPADVVSTYAKACFGTDQSLPDIPTEVSYVKKDGDNYVITAGDMGDMSFEVKKAYKNADGTFTGIIELGTSEGTLGTYKLTFKADDGENALCPYDVTDAALVK